MGARSGAGRAAEALKHTNRQTTKAVGFIDVVCLYVWLCPDLGGRGGSGLEHGAGDLSGPRGRLTHYDAAQEGTVDIYSDPMLNVADAATYLAMPQSTLGAWRKTHAVHSVEAEVHGGPTLPFVAMIEAFVLRSLREAGFPPRRIRDAAEGARAYFNDPYGLARPGIVHDGTEIFIDAGGEYLRAKDRQQAIRETVRDFKKFIVWEGDEPKQLKLRQFGGSVILDPRFGWGRPVVAANRVPIESIMGLWHAGETMATIGEEFDMGRDEIERLIQDYDRSLQRSAA